MSTVDFIFGPNAIATEFQWFQTCIQIILLQKTTDAFNLE